MTTIKKPWTVKGGVIVAIEPKQKKEKPLFPHLYTIDKELYFHERKQSAIYQNLDLQGRIKFLNNNNNL